MKTIGLIGGLSWESTIPYYTIMNEEVRTALGGFHSAKILMESVDFAEYEPHLETHDWASLAKQLSSVALRLERGGASEIVIASNTMHKAVPAMEEVLSIPILHIANATADALLASHVRKVGLLGTKITLTEDFYKKILIDRGLQVLIPDAPSIERVNDIIFSELCVGLIKESSREALKAMIASFKAQGAEAVILGCTELGLLVSQDDSVLPVFDTTVIHARRAAQDALS